MKLSNLAELTFAVIENGSPETEITSAAGLDIAGTGDITFLANPAHESFYGKRNDRMPAFGAEQILNAQAIGLVADWLRGQWYEPASP